MLSQTDVSQKWGALRKITTDKPPMLISEPTRNCQTTSNREQSTKGINFVPAIIDAEIFTKLIVHKLVFSCN